MDIIRKESLKIASTFLGEISMKWTNGLGTGHATQSLKTLDGLYLFATIAVFNLQRLSNNQISGRYENKNMKI